MDLQRLKTQLKQHLQHRFPQLEPFDLQPLAHGEANLIYRLNQKYLVRVAINTPNQRFGGEAQRLTQFEQMVLQYLNETEITHELQGAFPKPDRDFPYSYLITNFLRGGALDYSRSHLAQCAQTLAQLHRLPLLPEYAIAKLTPKMPVIQQPLTLFYEESKAYAKPYLDSPQANPEIVDMLQAMLAKAQTRLQSEELVQKHPHVCLVHSDHTYDNWVMNEQQAYLIDWEWAELSSPAGDLGHFLSPITIKRFGGYKLPSEDREFFLQSYYDALEDEHLAKTVQQHFRIFGVFPAVRSLCWTAGYWITASRWYESMDDTPSTATRLSQLQESQQQFPTLWQEVMAWLEEES